MQEAHPQMLRAKQVETGAAEAVETQTAEKKEAPHYSYRMVMHNFGPWDDKPEMAERWEEEYNADLILFMWKLQMQVTALT